MPRGSGTAGGPPAHPPVAGPGSSQLLTQTLRGPHVRGVPGVCRMRKGADDDRDARHPPPHDRNESIPCVPARLPHLKPPNAAAAAARRLASHRPPPARTAPRRLFSRPIASKGGKAMAAVHYYLGRPARVWISAQSRRRPARPSRYLAPRRQPGAQPQTLPAHIGLAAPIGQRGTGDLRQYAKNGKNESSNTLSNRPRLSRYDRTSPRGGRQSCRRRADHPVLFPHAGSLPG